MKFLLIFSTLQKRHAIFTSRRNITKLHLIQPPIQQTLHRYIKKVEKENQSSTENRSHPFPNTNNSRTRRRRIFLWLPAIIHSQSLNNAYHSPLFSRPNFSVSHSFSVYLARAVCQVIHHSSLPPSSLPPPFCLCCPRHIIHYQLCFTLHNLWQSFSSTSSSVSSISSSLLLFSLSSSPLSSSNSLSRIYPLSFIILSLTPSPHHPLIHSPSSWLSLSLSQGADRSQNIN